MILHGTVVKKESGGGQFRRGTVRRTVKVDKRDEEKRASQTTAAFVSSKEETGSEFEEGEEDDDSAKSDKKTQNRCKTTLRQGITYLVPGLTPVFMYATLFLVTWTASFSQASQGYPPDFRFYNVYLCLSAVIILGFLIARVALIMCFGRFFSKFSTRIFAALATVLDPQATYLIFTITLSIFWSNSLTMVDPDQTGPTVQYYFLGHQNWRFTYVLENRNKFLFSKLYMSSIDLGFFLSALVTKIDLSYQKLKSC